VEQEGIAPDGVAWILCGAKTKHPREKPNSLAESFANTKGGQLERVVGVD
jgi:hypothetical protein